MPEISSDAQKVLSGATTAEREFALSNTPGDKLTSGEANKLLQQFRANPNNVFSTDNINQASTNPQVAPDDLLGIRAQIQRELGVPEAQQRFQDAFSQLKEFDVTTQEQQRQIEEKQVGLSVIRGAQAAASRLRGQERLGIATEAEVAQSALLAAQQEARAQFGIREGDVRARQQLILSNPGAKITFGDSIEGAAKKIAKYNEEVQRDAYKDELQSIAINMGISTKTKKGGTKSISSLEKDIAKQNKEAIDMAKAASVRSTSSGGSGGAGGGYTSQEQRKLRAAGINPNDVGAADDYLYGSGYTPEQKTQLKLEDSLANSVQRLVSDGVPRDLIQKNTLDPYGYNIDDISDAYDIDISSISGNYIGQQGFLGSGAGFWSNVWSGTKNIIGF